MLKYLIHNLQVAWEYPRQQSALLTAVMSDLPATAIASAPVLQLFPARTRWRLLW